MPTVDQVIAAVLYYDASLAYVRISAQLPRDADADLLDGLASVLTNR